MKLYLFRAILLFKAIYIYIYIVCNIPEWRIGSFLILLPLKGFFFHSLLLVLQTAIRRSLQSYPELCKASVSMSIDKNILLFTFSSYDSRRHNSIKLFSNFILCFIPCQKIYTKK